MPYYIIVCVYILFSISISFVLFIQIIRLQSANTLPF